MIPHGPLESTLVKIESLEEQEHALREKLSELRKKCGDPFIAEMTLRSLKAKLMMYRVTEDPKDLKKAEAVLEQATALLEEASAKPMVNVAEEIGAIAQSRMNAEEAAKKIRIAQKETA